MDNLDEIYYTLIGELAPSEELFWVSNAFAPGSDCDKAYDRLVNARNRVLTKLQAPDDDDLNQMLTEMATIQRALCRHLLILRQP